jgi:glycerophosphoryl diester phosphodiesterase
VRPIGAAVTHGLGGRPVRFPPRRPLTALLGLTLAAAGLAGASFAADAAPAPAVTLEGRAVLPATTLASGPPSGGLLGTAPINGITPPFRGQPVQGFSAVLDDHDGTFSVMPDNGYGAIENSADFDLRVYRIRPRFATGEGGAGTIDVQSFVELRDPQRRIPFAIVNELTKSRVLTGADFDIESMQRAPDGTLWFGDEFGPFLLHASANGTLLDAPVPLPDKDHPGQEVRSPQNPFSEESASLRVMNAFRAHARAHGNTKPVIFSPDYHLLDDGDPATVVDNRKAPPAGSGSTPRRARSSTYSRSRPPASRWSPTPWTTRRRWPRCSSWVSRASSPTAPTCCTPP